MNTRKIASLCLALTLTTSIVCYSQEPEEVYLEVVQESDEPGPIVRTPASIPITCYYYPEAETVYLTFLADCGVSTVNVTSVSMTGMDTYEQNGTGVCVIPLSTTGLTIINIYTGDGRHYRAIVIAY